VDLAGIPPVTPAPDQLIARLGLRMPDHCWPYERSAQSKTSEKTEIEVKNLR
jgi:hypothetical protein